MCVEAIVVCNFFYGYAEGKIVKLSPESIHCVVLGFSAAVVTDVDIREEFKYKVVCMSYI